MASRDQKIATTGDQTVNARQIPLKVDKLMLDRLADVADMETHLPDYNKKLLTRLFTVCTRFVTKTSR
jgi:hypothetical protein